tara:strand:+ start:52 stop:411 length:360 start_codon:yes stop_codon:yes gene_type:complete
VVYVLIPEGSELKKVTKLQKDAVSAYNRHENIKTLLGNEKVPLLVAGGVLLASAPTILKLIFDALAKQKPEFDIDITEGAVNYGIFVKDFAEGFFELTSPSGGLFEGEAKDFWDKYVKK